MALIADLIADAREASFSCNTDSVIGHCRSCMANELRSAKKPAGVSTQILPQLVAESGGENTMHSPIPIIDLMLGEIRTAQFSFFPPPDFSRIRH